MQVMNDKSKPIQLEYTNLAKEKILNWAERQNLLLLHVDFIIPFVSSNKDLTVFFFYDTNKTLQNYRESGELEEVSCHFLKILEEIGYPHEYFAFVNFQNDTKENVDQNFGGKYFYRLR